VVRAILTTPFIFLGLAVILFYHGSGEYFQPGGDPFIYIWCLNWWPFAISQHINPAISDFIWSPHGYPMLWANSIPTLALLLAPITTHFGAVVSWNIVDFITPPANAYAAFFLLKYLTKKIIPSIVGAVVFGFSAYITAQQLGHVSLSLVPLVPIALLLILRRLNGEVGSKSFIASMTVLMVAQFGVSTEILASSAFFGVVGAVAFYPRYNNDLDLRGIFRDFAFVALWVAIILSPAFYYMILGTKDLPSHINPPEMFSNDLLGFVIPTPIMFVNSATLKNLASRFTGNYSEEGAYLGAVLILVTILLGRQLRDERWMRPLVVTLVTILLCSLGPTLWIAGVNTHIPLPWKFFTFVPVIKHALPCRFSLYASLAIAVIIAMGISRIQARSTRLWTYAAVLIGLCFWIPNPKYYAFADVKIPLIFSKDNVQKLFGKNANIIVLPYGYLGNSILWQYKSDMSFKMAGGYVGFVPQTMWKYRALMYLYDAEYPDSQDVFNADVTIFCRENSITHIVMTKETSAKLTAELMNTPWPKSNFGDSVIISIPNLRE
jgi:hypothetical protein